jgi:hypothetical protein
MRAPPKQWAKYAQASLVIKILRDKLPFNLYEVLTETIFVERRSEFKAKFYDNLKGKVGRQKLGNSLHFMAAIGEDWFGKDLSNDKIQIMLKRIYFYYLTI